MQVIQSTLRKWFAHPGSMGGMVLIGLAEGLNGVADGTLVRTTRISHVDYVDADTLIVKTEHSGAVALHKADVADPAMLTDENFLAFFTPHFDQGDALVQELASDVDNDTLRAAWNLPEATDDDDGTGSSLGDLPPFLRKVMADTGADGLDIDALLASLAGATADANG